MSVEVSISHWGQFDVGFYFLPKSKPAPRVFYRRDLGTFWSWRDDLSDLGGDYLVAALANLAAKSGAQKPQLGANRHTF